MNKISSDELYYYDKEIIKEIKMKYNFSYMEAFKNFVNSETYRC